MQSLVCGAGEISICDASVVCCLCLAHWVSYSTRATMQSQTPILSSSSVEEPDHRKQILVLPNGLSKPGERAHVIN